MNIKKKKKMTNKTKVKSDNFSPQPAVCPNGGYYGARKDHLALGPVPALDGPDSPQCGHRSMERRWAVAAWPPGGGGGGGRGGGGEGGGRACRLLTWAPGVHPTLPSIVLSSASAQPSDRL